MLRITSVLIVMTFVCLQPMMAQEFSYGFKAGLNFSTFSGDLESDETGEVEEFANTTGFHVGAIFNLKFDDVFGLRGELLYSQKGARHRFDGDSYDILTSVDGKRIVGIGGKRISVNISNSYIDVPVMAYAKIADRIEFSAGASVGVLVGSRGSGEQLFKGGASGSGFPIEEYFYTLDYEYFGDEAGEVTTEAVNRITIGGDDVDVPVAIGAYYYDAMKDGNYFNALDLGLIGGVSVYFNKGLFFGARLNYGLSDLTNNFYDYSQVEIDETFNRISREDVDRTLSIQATVGFSF